MTPAGWTARATGVNTGDGASDRRSTAAAPSTICPSRPDGISMRGRAAIADALGRLEPPPRLVDWSLFAVVCAEAVTGLVSFTIGTPAGWPVFRLHRALGLAIVALIGCKLSRVRIRLLRRRLWQR